LSRVDLKISESEWRAKMIYRIEMDGFVNHFDKVSEMKEWAESLIRRYPDMIGKKARIYKAVWVAKDGSGAQYAGVTKEVVIGA